MLAAAGCGRPTSTTAVPAEPPPPLVRVVSPEMRGILLTVSQPGSIQAYEQTPIYAKVPGYVLNWYVDIGDVVGAEELLAELWAPELVSELDLKTEESKVAVQVLAMADAQAATASAQISEAQAALGRAEAVHDYWKGQKDHFAKLVKENVLDKQSREDTNNQYRMAAAALTEAHARVASAKALLQEKQAAQARAKADIRAADASVRRQADLVGYATFQAPYAGVVTRRNISTFDFVQPPTAGKGDPLYVIERRDLMRVVVDVPETDAVWVARGTTARIRVLALKREFTARVARTAYSLDPQARTLRAEIDLDNAADLLRPGMYVSAVLESQRPKTLTLPAAAVVTEGDVNVGYKHFCYVVMDGRARRTPIEIGLRSGKFVEVLKKQIPGGSEQWQDLAGSEEVIAQGLSGLRDGQAVQVKRTRE